MITKVINREYVYIGGKRANKVKFDKVDNCRDIYYRDGVYVKIDPAYYSTYDESQSKTEYYLYNKFNQREKKLFVPIMDFGSFIEDGKRIYWISQKEVKYKKLKFKELEEHKDYGLLCRIESKYNLIDISLNTDNRGLTDDGNIVIWDYGCIDDEPDWDW